MNWLTNTPFIKARGFFIAISEVGKLQRRLRTRYFLIICALIMFAANVTHAFEVDGLKSGISMNEARRLLESYSYKEIEIKENSIMASDEPSRVGRFIVLSFCKDKLVQVQKHLKPRFDYFVRFVNEKRRDFGRPADAWTRPTDVTSNFESNSVSFLWRDGPTFVTVTYTEFNSNNQLDLIYSISNVCWQTP